MSIYYLKIIRGFLAVSILSLTMACRHTDYEELICSEDKIWASTYNRFMPVDSEDYSWVSSHTLDQSLQEVSGIVSGRKNPFALYMHEDSGNRNVVFVFDTLGVLLGEIVLAGAVNRDWEDIAIGPGPIPGETYIYVADFGDNRAVRGEVRIHRFIEPVIDNMQTGTFKMIVDQYETITYQYPDGPRDAETLLLDPETADLIVITKRESQVHVYQLPSPQKTEGYADIYFRGYLPFKMIVGGDISPDGDEILIKDYGAIYYWRRNGGDLFETLFHTVPDKVAYIEELKGEAVGWSHDGQGYYTISEVDRWQVEPEIRSYRRK